MDQKIAQQIRNWVLEYATEHQLWIVDIQIVAKKITIFADTLTNITIEECARMSRNIQHQIDEHYEVLSEYTLGVSSPGMTNGLKMPFQYQKRIGKSLEVTLTDGKKVEGTVTAADDNGITIEEVIPKNKKTKEAEKTVQHIYTYQQINQAFIPIKF